MTEVVLRCRSAADGELAVAVWRAASAARRGGRPVRAEHEERVRSYIRKPDAFLLLAEDAGEVVGMGVGMQGLADDGAGPPVPELCHIAMIFVAPERWGEGIGGRVLGGVLEEARSRGYERAQSVSGLGRLRSSSFTRTPLEASSKEAAPVTPEFPRGAS